MKFLAFSQTKILGSSLALPANGLGGSRATSLLVAHFALQNTKFGNEKEKVQNPARIPPQTPPAGGKKAEAGQFHSPRKIVCPADLSAVALAEAESKLVIRIFSKRLVRTSALPTALWFWISKMPSKLRKNTMPRRFAPRLFLMISQKVKIGGGRGIRTLGILRHGGLVNRCTRPLCDPSESVIVTYFFKDLVRT